MMLNGVLRHEIYQFARSVESTRAVAKVHTKKDIYHNSAWIQLISYSGNSIGMAYMTWNFLFYSIHVIKVSSPNCGRGLGRLLQIETALCALENDILLKMTFAQTCEGRRCFSHYPITSKSILECKLKKDMKPILDVPWEEPKVSLNGLRIFS